MKTDSAGLDPDHFDREWDRCAAWIEAALAHCGGTHTLDDVKAAVLRGEATFWTGKRSAMVTQIINYPRLRAFHFWLAGGELEELRDELRVRGEAWAKAQGCAVASITGRLGWARALGYRPIHHTCGKELG